MNRPDTTDGQWHVGDVYQTRARRTFYRNQYVATVYWGRIFRRLSTGKWESDDCGHDHNKRSAAKKCSEKLARRWNKLDLPEPEKGTVQAEPNRYGHWWARRFNGSQWGAWVDGETEELARTAALTRA